MGNITIPMWLFVVMCVTFLWFLFEKVTIPIIHKILKNRIRKTIAEIAPQLKVSIKPFQLTKHRVLVDRLTHDPAMVAAVEKQAHEQQVNSESLKAEVEKYAREIIPAFNAYLYFRWNSMLAKGFSQQIYRVRGRIVDNESLARIDPAATVVFVMNHRSNMDYVLTTYLTSQQTILSYAVGEWANFWPLRPMIQAMGAFFVRRNSKNPLYRKVLERYVYMATREGVCQAVFPEGKLSRDGSLQPPKLGFLDYILRSFDGTHRDIVFIPVGINYDRTMEDKTLLRSLDPKAERRSLWYVITTTTKFFLKNGLTSRDTRWKRFGYAGVNFGRPISAREYCEKNNVNFAVSKEQRSSQVEKFAQVIMQEISYIIPILPVPLVATVLMKKSGINELEVKIEVYKLIERLQKLKAPIRDSEKPQENTLMNALKMLLQRNIIELKDGLYHVKPEVEPLLSYYANSIGHWFTKDESS